MAITIPVLAWARLRGLRARDECQHLLPWLHVLLDASLVHVRLQWLVWHLASLRPGRLHADACTTLLHGPLAAPRQLVHGVLNHPHALLYGICLGILYLLYLY
jgi:hypothetical protein